MSEEEEQVNITELKITLRLTPEAMEMVLHQWHERAWNRWEQGIDGVLSIEEVVSAMLNEAANGGTG